MRFLQTVVRCYIGSVVIIFALRLHHSTQTVGARSVSLLLMLLLQSVGRVAENLSLFCLLGILGDGETSVEHILIVFDNSGISAELVIKFVLGVGQNVALVAHSGSV